MSVLDEMALGTRKYHSKVAKLCEPLKQYYGINVMGYIEINNEGRLINILTHRDWLEHCYENQYFVDDPHMVSPDNMGSGFVLWSSYQKDYYLNGMLRDCVENFNICHGVTYVEKNDYGFKLYGFGTSKENFQIHNKILSNLDCLKKFIAYLDKQLEPIRQDLGDHRIDFSEVKGNQYYEQEGLIRPKDDKIEQYRFLKQLGLIEDDIKNVNFSKREIQCIKLYLEGKSATQTAKILSLSPRTIESHMENIKSKLKINFKRELFDKAKVLKELQII